MPAQAQGRTDAVLHISGGHLASQVCCDAAYVYAESTSQKNLQR